MSQPHGPTQPKWQVREVQERVAQQRELARHTIARGTPTQAAEDQLRELEQALLRMRSGADTTSEIQLKMRDR
jgi:hypothetical protein